MSDTGTVETKQSTDTRRLREQASAVKEDVRELGRAAKEISKVKLRETKDAASEYLEKRRQKVGELEDSVVAYVREKPVKSVLMAAGAGALLAFLLSRR